MSAVGELSLPESRTGRKRGRDRDARTGCVCAHAVSILRMRPYETRIEYSHSFAESEAREAP